MTNNNGDNDKKNNNNDNGNGNKVEVGGYWTNLYFIVMRLINGLAKEPAMNVNHSPY